MSEPKKGNHLTSVDTEDTFDYKVEIPDEPEEVSARPPSLAYFMIVFVLEKIQLQEAMGIYRSRLSNEHCVFGPR